MNNFFVDTECLKLAEYFFKGYRHSPDDVRRLAMEIQELVENFTDDFAEESP